MTTALLLRIASIISCIFAAGHILGGFKFWSPMGDNAVLQSKKTVRFDIMGANRGYFDLYMGFGWTIAVYLVMQSILIWQLASLANQDAANVRPIISVIALAAAAAGVVAWLYIFPVPALFSLALCVCLVGAIAVAAQ